MKITTYFILFLLILGLFNAVNSLPLIDASTPKKVFHNQLIEIHGRNFNLKDLHSKSKPLRFETFEVNDLGKASTVGNTMASEINYWEDKELLSDSNPLIANTNKRSIYSERHASFLLRRPGSGVETAQVAWKNNIGFSLTGKAYVNLWVRYYWPNNSPSASYQVKVFSITSALDKSANSTLPDFSLFNWWYAVEAPYTQTYFRNTWSNTSSGTYMFPNNSLPIKMDPTWINFAVAIDQGTPNIADGSYTIYMTNTTGGTIRKKTATNVKLRENSNFFDAFKMGWYIGSTIDIGEVILLFDDIYFDNSWARVEIGDKPVYDNCTHREIQILDSWNRMGNPDPYIEIKINRGSFENGSAFLFVVDKYGTPSDGYEIEIYDEPK